MTWFALVRSELSSSIAAGKSSSRADIVDPRETAHIDALTEMYGSDEFRQAASKWSPVFMTLVLAHDRWLYLFQQTPPEERVGDENLARVQAELHA